MTLLGGERGSRAVQRNYSPSAYANFENIKIGRRRSALGATVRHNLRVWRLSRPFRNPKNFEKTKQRNLEIKFVG